MDWLSDDGYHPNVLKPKLNEEPSGCGCFTLIVIVAFLIFALSRCSMPF